MCVADRISSDDIRRVLDSIADNSSYFSFNVKPVDSAIALLRTHFNPTAPPDDRHYSLELSSRAPRMLRNLFSFAAYSQKYFGTGACLAHDHKTQYFFVLQSLSLWREIMVSMPRLWLFADLDMLVEHYRFADTGQGFQRIQSCPRVGGEMRRILKQVQESVGSPWVGLSVVHLGDRDVPNGE
jgi:hypothetical protein